MKKMSSKDYMKESEINIRLGRASSMQLKSPSETEARDTDANENLWIGRLLIESKPAYLLNIRMDSSDSPTHENVLAAFVEDLLPAYLGEEKWKALNRLRSEPLGKAVQQNQFDECISYSMGCHRNVNDAFPEAVRTLSGKRQQKSIFLLEDILNSVELRPNDSMKFFPDIERSAIFIPAPTAEEAADTAKRQRVFTDECGI